MKILITGITGMLGTELAQTLKENHELYGLTLHSPGADIKTYNVDIADKDAVYETVSKINPDLVMHTAAMSNVDECEKNPESAYLTNAIGTRNIALACQRFDAAMLYVSTDYVFSGTKKPKNGYAEFDNTDPISVYGKSKLWGEQFVGNLLNKFYIVRTSWLFGKIRPNHVSQTAENLKAGKVVRVVTDMTSSPTYVPDLSKALVQLIETSKYGTWHISNSGFVSRYEIAATIAEIINSPRKLIKKIKLNDLKLPAKRPSFSGLRNYMRELEGFAPLRNWKEAIKEFLTEQKYI